ncbi:hypothetical protein [Streptomyces huiliensis]|uniref:hypothetical protein n=1 Tax=Streptomyces huiliensis TaxID=2876027 RepID=UPI001CBAD58D|nr:hypothetical protein [Streptomyces huiliensis]MBZ4318363.1 hypothetical protein [Streptomyces huiliensis]
MSSKSEVPRRMHHRYVARRGLDSPEGDLAIRVVQGAKAISRSRAVEDGDFLDGSEPERKLKAVRWRVLVVAAGRGDRPGRPRP